MRGRRCAGMEGRERALWQAQTQKKAAAGAGGMRGGGCACASASACACGHMGMCACVRLLPCRGRGRCRVCGSALVRGERGMGPFSRPLVFCTKRRPLPACLLPCCAVGRFVLYCQKKQRRAGVGTTSGREAHARKRSHRLSRAWHRGIFRRPRGLHRLRAGGLLVRRAYCHGLFAGGAAVAAPGQGKRAGSGSSHQSRAHHYAGVHRGRQGVLCPHHPRPLRLLLRHDCHLEGRHRHLRRHFGGNGLLFRLLPRQKAPLSQGA